MTWIIKDPFAGSIEVEGDTLEEAVEMAYSDIPEDERPTHVWFDGKKVNVKGGTCYPNQ